MGKDPYRRTAKWYDQLFGSLNAGVRAIGMKMYPPEAGMVVLDVGCGTGAHLGLYQQKGCEVFGIDTSPAMLDVARRRLGDRADLHLGDAANTPYPDGKFDLITATLTLHEMPPAVRAAVLDEAKRILRQDGRILLVDFHPGPLRPPRGWFFKIVILLSEIAAGREHFKNYRHFMAHKGLPHLIEAHGLAVDKQKIVSGGNLGMFLLSVDR